MLSFVATVVNYEYCFYWMFYQVSHSSLNLHQVTHPRVMCIDMRSVLGSWHLPGVRRVHRTALLLLDLGLHGALQDVCEPGFERQSATLVEVKGMTTKQRFVYRVQDGTIEYQIKLTGELSTNPVSPDEDPTSPTYGTLVAQNVNAQAHQHLVRTQFLLTL